ncbi:MAG TPA: transcription antitermination factor NusB [Thermoanaerobaculia bacterium]|nr:transcription antitermination factor NusB [Thermoanaerobaculia bacterium]
MSSKRHTAREMALQMLYQLEMGGSTAPQVLKHFDLSEYLVQEGGERKEDPEKVRRRAHDAFDYARTLFQGSLEHREEIDRLIRSQADNWRLERMPVVDRNVLRLAIYEMLHHADVPKLVVLDEAIELAKRYGSEQSGRFVNGLLDGLLKQRAIPGGVP